MPDTAQTLLTRVVSIWAEVLQVKPSTLKPDEHLLLQGGDSLHLARILARIKQEFGFALSLEAVTAFSTPQKMALCCAAMLQEQRDQDVQKEQVPRKELNVLDAGQANRLTLLPEYPATSMQQGLWFAEQLSGNAGLYSAALCLRLRGRLDKPALFRCIVWLLESASTLLCGFKLCFSTRRLMVQNQVLDRMSASAAKPALLQEMACSEDEVNAIFEQVLAQTGDMGVATLCRFALLTLPGAEYRLLLSCHHALCDGWSGAILLRKLCTAYTNLLEHGVLPAAETDLEFQHYALREAALLQDAELCKRRLSWWQQYLSGSARTNEWLWQNNESTAWPHQLDQLTYIPDRELLQTCQLFAAQQELSVFTQMLTAWLLALQQFSGVADQVIGIPVADRQAQAESSIGCFTRLVILRQQLDPEQDLLQQARALTVQFQQAQQQWLPLNTLVTALKPRLLPDGNAWFSQLFAFQNFPAASCSLPELDIQIEALPAKQGQYALKLEVLPKQESWQVQVEYAHDLFTAEQIAALLQSFESKLGQLVLYQFAEA